MATFPQGNFSQDFLRFLNGPANDLRDLVRPISPFLTTNLPVGTSQRNPASSSYDLSNPAYARAGVQTGTSAGLRPGALNQPADRMGSSFDAAASRADVRRRIPNRTTAWTPEPPVVKDAAYYMNLATQGLTGVDFSGLSSRAQQSVAGADERVKAMYRAMREIQAEESANREASRSEAGQAITASADQAASDIAQGYNNAIGALADEMAALGLADTLGSQNTQRIAADSGRNQAISRQLGQISGNLNTQLGQADSAFNQQTRDITGLEGANFRSTMQSDLLNRLAELDAAQQQQNQQLPLQRLQYAQGLRGYDQSFEPYTPSFSEQLDAQKLINSQAQSQTKLFNDAFLQFIQAGDDEATALQKAQDYVDYLTSQ
jgi:hypothetical protein